MKKAIASILVLSLFAGGALATDVYDNEAGFLAAIGTTEYLLEDFTGLPAGVMDYTYDVGPEFGYSGTISAEGLANSTLWSCGDAVSTDNATDWLRVDFTGDDVYSTAGWFYATDIGCNFIAGSTIVIDLSDGTHYEFVPTSTTDFRGFVTAEPITWMTMDAPDTPVNLWTTMDHYYIDSPEPGSLALLVLGGLAVIRRR
jgi:hypothetical protein